MLYQERKSSPDVSGVIKHFWSLEHDGVYAEPEVILPDGSPEIVFNLGDRFRRLNGRDSELQPATLIAGQITRRIVIRPTGAVKLFGIRLTPTGAFAIGRMPQNELTDSIPDVRSVFGRLWDRPEEAVNLARNFEQRIAAVEGFVRERLARTGECTGTTGAAVDLIMRSSGNISIAGLSDLLNRSERSLGRDFLLHVGVTPKMFARITRFHGTVRRIGSASTSSMSETALSSGYFDQSHMIRDFQQFAGMSPGEFFKDNHTLSELFTSAG